LPDVAAAAAINGSAVPSGVVAVARDGSDNIENKVVESRLDQQKGINKGTTRRRSKVGEKP